MAFSLSYPTALGGRLSDLEPRGSYRGSYTECRPSTGPSQDHGRMCPARLGRLHSLFDCRWSVVAVSTHPPPNCAFAKVDSCESAKRWASSCSYSYMRNGNKWMQDAITALEKRLEEGEEPVEAPTMLKFRWLLPPLPYFTRDERVWIQMPFPGSVAAYRSQPALFFQRFFCWISHLTFHSMGRTRPLFQASTLFPLLIYSIVR